MEENINSKNTVEPFEDSAKQSEEDIKNSHPKKRFFENKLFMLFISFLISIGLWFYVNGVYNPQDTKEIKGVPITINFEGSVPQQNDLTILEMETKTVDIKVEGSRVLLANLKKDDISITVDLDTVTAAAECHLPLIISLPNSDQLTVSEQSVASLYIVFDKYEKKDIEVKVSITGSPDENYMLGEIAPSPSSVYVEGPKTLVDKIANILIETDISGMTTGKTERQDVVMVDENNIVIKSEYLKCEFDAVSAYIPVLKMMEVPLTVSTVNKSGGTDDAVITKEITPTMIMVAGPQADIDLLNQLSLGVIDTSQIEGEKTFTYQIPVPSGMKLISEETEITVKVLVSGAVSQTFEVSQFELSGVPDGTTVTPISNSIVLTVRGISADMALLKESDITAVIDASAITTTSGAAVCPVTFTLPSGLNIGVVGKYSVVVTVS